MQIVAKEADLVIPAEPWVWMTVVGLVLAAGLVALVIFLLRGRV
jgi:hypothetical protein